MNQKSIKNGLLFFMLTLFNNILIGQSQYIQQADFGKILDSLNIKGSILVFDNQNDTYYSNNFEWAKEGNLPASTFKIPNSLIALETGVVKNEKSVSKWYGEKRRMKIWEQDLTLKKAFQVSCVPCYQEIARKIGLERMKTYLKKFNYETMVFDSNTLDKFWLEGDSKISQFQQIDFLKRFYFSKLPISKRTYKIMRKIMLSEKGKQYSISAKTGWGARNGKDNGWYVGFVEKKQKVYFFATNVIPTEGLNMDNFAPVRLTATKAALKILKIIE